MIYDEIITSSCPICFLPSPLLTLTCSHSFCSSCLSSYLSLKILDADVRSLPCPACSDEFSPSEIAKLVPAAVFLKYERFKKTKDLEQSVFVKWCPQPDCNGYDVAASDNYHLICKECKHHYCYLCSRPWHTGKCRLSIDKGFARWASAESVRICPRCKAFVQKEGGCPHMTCSKCKFDWCWHCGKQYKSTEHSKFNCFVGRGKFNSFWYIIFFCLMFPLVVPFWLFFYLVYRVEVANDFFLVDGKIKRFKYFLYIIGIVLSPLAFSALGILPLILYVKICVRLNKLGVQLVPNATTGEKAAICVLNLILAMPALVLIIVLAIASVAVGCILLPPFGAILLVAKLVYSVIRLTRPATLDYPGAFTA
jgi:hypothetical protein